MSLAKFHLLGFGADNPQISPFSLWLDDVWQLETTTAGMSPLATSMRWDFEMPDGSRFTAPQWSALRQDCKKFAWSLFTDPRGGKPMKAGSAAPILTGLAYLVRWIAAQGFTNFSELDNAAGSQFLQDLEVNLAKTPLDELDSQISESAAWLRINTWRLLWRQTDALLEAGVPALPEAPFGGRSAKDITEQITTKARGRIPPLPDEVALPIINAAHRIIGIPADDVIKLQDSFLEARQTAPSRSGSFARQGRSSQRAAVRESLTGYEFSTIPGENEPWRPPLQPVGGAIKILGVAHQLRQLITDVVSACVIVLQSTSGQRISEICGLEIGSPAGTPFDELNVERRFSKTGLNELFFLRGWLFKTRDIPEKVEWLIASRPTGSTTIPPSLRALQVLSALLHPWRSLSNDPKVQNALVVTFTNTHGLPINGACVSRPFSEGLRHITNVFIRKSVDFSVLPDTSKAGEDIRPYKSGQRVKPHQWRKSFALYLFRLDSRLLPAVQQQFKHLSLAMTEQGYIGNDPTLLATLDNVRLQESVKFFFRNATGKEPSAGKFSYVIDEYRDEIKRFIKGDDVQNQAALERWIVEHDLRIWFTDFGKCFVGLSPANAVCHKDAKTSHWSRATPNMQSCGPGQCLECACFSVDRDHVDYWENRYITNRDAWETACKAGEEREFAVVRKRYLQAEELLRRLQLPLPEVTPNG